MSEPAYMKDCYESIPDCIYMHDDPESSFVTCSKHGGPYTCIGLVGCNEYAPKKEVLHGTIRYDAVSKPSHYTEGRKYEPKDVIRDWDLNFNLGNTVKYVARAGRKDDILQDLKKARQYLDFEIEYLEKEREEK